VCVCRVYIFECAADWPNGSEYKCCQCCERQSYVTGRIAEETAAFPADGIFNDNVIASRNWLSYYTAISGAVHKTDTTRAMGMNLNCANGAWPPLAKLSSHCSPVCMQFGHKSSECSWCRSPRCSNLTQEFFDLADVHIMAETSRKMLTDPNAYEMHLGFKKSIANRNKMSMFTYGAHDSEWQKLIELAAAQGYTKFWVTGDGQKHPDDQAGLPHFFDEMIDYIAQMNNGTDWMKV
jgi:hypothetical protein